MADLVEFYDNTEAKILSLTPEDPQWVNKAFYYPIDKAYFYRAIDGEMKKYGGGVVNEVGTGVTLNDKVIGGVKTYIAESDILNIPEYYDYNTFSLTVEGQVINEGQINIQ